MEARECPKESENTKMPDFYDQLQHSLYLKHFCQSQAWKGKIQKCTHQSKKMGACKGATVCSWIFHDLREMPNSSDKLFAAKYSLESKLLLFQANTMETGDSLSSD